MSPITPRTATCRLFLIEAPKRVAVADTRSHRAPPERPGDDKIEGQRNGPAPKFDYGRGLPRTALRRIRRPARIDFLLPGKRNSSLGAVNRKARSQERSSLAGRPAGWTRAHRHRHL